MKTPTMIDSKNISELLQVCREIELLCAKIYRVYADGFAEDEELRALWTKTLAEEENHAHQFKMAINLRRDNAIECVKIDKIKGSEVLSMLKNIYDGILVKLPSKIDALQSAINLEKNLSSFHLDAVAIFQDVSMKKMFQAMMKADDHHVQRIEEMYRKRLEADKYTAQQ